MNIAILGYGTIGKGVEKLAGENGIEVRYILMRDIDELTKPNMTRSIDEIVEDKNTDLVLECIGGDEPAFTFAKKAIEHGKHFISSNKKMIAKHYEELVQLADKYKVHFLYSSACGGGIPWLKELACIRNSDELYSYKGIMNGTSNYILHKMYYENLGFEEALKKAQELGYAEADPSDDIDGVDTANKSLLSLGVGYEMHMNLSDIFVKGIRYYSKEDMEYAKNNDKKVVLLGKGIKTDKGIAVYVIPTFVGSDSIFYSIKENYNCFIADVKNLGQLSLIGQGAGSLPTASSVIRDIQMIDTPYRVDFKGDIKPDYETLKSCFYIRSRNTIEDKYIKERIGNAVITKKMSIAELKNIISKEDFVGEIEC